MQKYLCILCPLLLLLVISCSQETTEEKPIDTPEEESSEESSSTDYNESLATEYGADAYGMKKYVMAFLKKGPNRDLTDEEAMELQMAHMENIGRMAEEGDLVLAGPFFGDGELRGIYIFNVQSIEEAEALTNTDPAVQAGSLEMELMEWYGSAALMAVNDIHAKLAQQSVTE